MTVYPGDLLHGDLNGVTTIPQEIASEVPEACKEFMAAEDIVFSYLKGGSITPAGMNEARRECTDAIARIGKRVRGES